MDELWKSFVDQMQDHIEIVNWQCFRCGKIYNESEKELVIKHIQEKHEYGRIYPRLSESAINELHELFDKSGLPWSIDEFDFLNKTGFKYIRVTGETIDEIDLEEEFSEVAEIIVGTFYTEPEILSGVISDHAERHKGCKFKSSTGFIKLTNLLENKIVFRRKMPEGLIKIDIRGTCWHRGDQALPNTLVSWKLLQLDRERVELRAYANCEEYFKLATQYLFEVYDHSVQIKRKQVIQKDLNIENMEQALAEVKDHLWDRKAVVLLWNGFEISDIARKVNRTTKTVRNRLSDLRIEHGEDVIPTREMVRNMRR